MAMIKVFDANGVKELNCFDTLDAVSYLVQEDEVDDTEPKDNNPFE